MCNNQEQTENHGNTLARKQWVWPYAKYIQLELYMLSSIVIAILETFVFSITWI